MYAAADVMMRRSGAIRRTINRAFYQFLARLDRHGEVILMNYGYHDEDADPIPLRAEDESHRLALQLYHKVASAVEPRGKTLLEVGSGRGGGAAYVHRTLEPASMTGVDYAADAVTFCKATHRAEGLKYVHGDAEDLPFEAEHFDAAINVESSHCYGSMARFLKEVHRVLKPGGVFSWADLRMARDVPALDEAVSESGLRVRHREDITARVLASLATHQSDHHRAIVDRNAPRLLRPLFYRFAGVEGTQNYDRFASREMIYLHMVMEKAQPGHK